MIMYQVFATVPDAVRDEWVAWMRDHHIPDVVKTGSFDHASFAEVQTSAHTWTHTCRYTTTSRERLDAYLAEHAPRLREEHEQRYGGVVITERVITNTLSEYRL
jgi:hypothetical protein